MACLKIPFPNRVSARRAATKNGRRLFEYKCPYCDYWHLSSKTPREIKALRKSHDDGGST